MKTQSWIPHTLLSVLLAAWIVSGCQSSDPGPLPVDWNAKLSRCTSCQDLETYLKTSAIRMLYTAYNGAGGLPTFLLLPGEPARDGALPPVPGSGQSPSEAHSDTNVQEPGVDEPDFVKTDGRYLYVVTAGQFLIYAAAPPEEAREVARFDVEGYGAELFVAHDTAVIFTTPHWGPFFPGSRPAEETYYGLKITILDIADRERPALVRELYVEGGLVTARRVESAVHVIVSSYLSFPALDYGLDLPANVERVRRSSLESWLPTVRDVVHGARGTETSTRPVSACENFYLPGRQEVGPLLTVLSIDLLEPTAPPREATIPSPAGTAYASSRSIYVSHADYSPVDFRSRTAVHKFDIGGGEAGAVYRASGRVDGWLLNQFSMGEHDGFLRVATTENRWGGPEQAPAPSNSLFVLEEAGSDLRVAGEVRNIAPDEQIYAARFLGDVGFLVTFEIIDPLFTFDLSDPYHPRLLGELEVPGFSTYIHPAGPDHLITIGQNTETDGNTAWFLGMQISLYDISDLADPRLTEMKILGTEGTHSEALYDHKAFNYFPPKEVLAFPIELHEASARPWRPKPPPFAGFLVYGVDLARGFSLLGQIDHDELYEARPECTFKRMRRTAIIGEAICTVSSAGIRIHDLDDLTRSLATLPFPECQDEVVPMPGPMPMGF